MAKRKSLTELRELALEGDRQREAAPKDEGGRGGEAPASPQEERQLAKRNRWVQLNTFVPGELRQALKIRALEEGRDMSDIVVELLTGYLDR